MSFRKSRILAGFVALGLTAGAATGAAAGTLVVSADEWPLSNSAFSSAPTTAGVPHLKKFPPLGGGPAGSHE